MFVNLHTCLSAVDLQLQNEASTRAVLAECGPDSMPGWLFTMFTNPVKAALESTRLTPWLESSKNPVVKNLVKSRKAKHLAVNIGPHHIRCRAVHKLTVLGAASAVQRARVIPVCFLSLSALLSAAPPGGMSRKRPHHSGSPSCLDTCRT